MFYLRENYFSILVLAGSVFVSGALFFFFFWMAYQSKGLLKNFYNQIVGLKRDVSPFSLTRDTSHFGQNFLKCFSYSFVHGKLSWNQDISCKISWNQEISWKLASMIDPKGQHFRVGLYQDLGGFLEFCQNRGMGLYSKVGLYSHQYGNYTIFKDLKVCLPFTFIFIYEILKDTEMDWKRMDCVFVFVFILFYFILFYFILFYFILFHVTLF